MDINTTCYYCHNLFDEYAHIECNHCKKKYCNDCWRYITTSIPSEMGEFDSDDDGWIDYSYIEIINTCKNCPNI